MSNAALQMDLDVDRNGKAFFVYFCPECRRSNRVPAKGLRSGSTVTCPCGETTIDLTGESLDGLQGLLDEMRSLRDLGFEVTFK